MADRPKVPGWNNINLNKPEEYSSEFNVDGNRYANVTNVTTGQRQLYLVSGIGGTPLTQRTLLSSTTSNGKVTQGEGYDDFVRVYGKGKLNNAEINNKKQSVALLSNPNISTQAEAKTVGESTEYKSSITNKANTPAEEDSKAALEKELGTSKSRVNFPQGLRYPSDLQIQYQDVIQFNMLKYEPRSLNANANEGLGSFGERKDYTQRTIGSVFLPIPAGISDTNSVTWGSDNMSEIELGLANIANSIIGEGAAAGADALENETSKVTNNSGEVKSALKAYFTGAAIGKANILSRTKGAIQNPNMELLFSGPTLRPFNFTFKLSARGVKDREQIRQIIRFFKQGMAVQRTQSQLFLKAPNTFKIRYLHKDKDHPYINKIKECALQSFTVNYTPEQTYMTFADGLMTSYEIQMTFQELEPIFNDDYGNLDGKSMDTEIGY